MQEITGDGWHYTCFLIHFKKFGGLFYFFVGFLVEDLLEAEWNMQFVMRNKQ